MAQWPKAVKKRARKRYPNVAPDVARLRSVADVARPDPLLDTAIQIAAKAEALVQLLLMRKAAKERAR